MKKILTLTLLTLLMIGSYVSARTIYDSTGRHIIYDDSIRGRKRAAQAQAIQLQKATPAAAAAKLDYQDIDTTVKIHKKFAQPTTKTVNTTMQSEYNKEE